MRQLYWNFLSSIAGDCVGDKDISEQGIRNTSNRSITDGNRREMGKWQVIATG